MSQIPFNVLFLCTGNSARSILAEAILNRVGAPRFRAYSAGSHPKRRPHPQAIAHLVSLGYETAHLRSKNWDEFAASGAPLIDLVVTVCDSAASEACPVWPGHPLRAHWAMPDPAAADEDSVEQAFAAAYRALDARIAVFVALPLSSLVGDDLQRSLDAIGRA